MPSNPLPVAKTNKAINYQTVPHLQGQVHSTAEICGELVFTELDVRSAKQDRNLLMVFIQQKLSSLSITCDIKLESAFYSVFYAEARKRPWTHLNDYGMI